MCRSSSCGSRGSPEERETPRKVAARLRELDGMPAATGAATGATGVTVTGVQGQVPHRRLLRLKPHSPAATSQRSSSEEMRAFSAACHTMPKKKAVVSGAGTGAAPAPDCSKLGRLLRHPESVLSSANKAKMATFCKWIAKEVRAEDCEMVIAFILLDRALAKSADVGRIVAKGVFGRERLLACTLLIAMKARRDWGVPSNQDMAAKLSMPLAHFNTWERFMLEGLDFDLFIDTRDYNSYCNLLSKAPPKPTLASPRMAPAPIPKKRSHSKGDHESPPPKRSRLAGDYDSWC